MTPAERQEQIRNATRNRARYFYELVTRDLFNLEIPKTKTKLKIAVLLSGGLRNFATTQEWANKFLIEPLNADVFVHGWCSKAGIEQDEETVKKYLNIKKYKILDRSKVTIPVPDVMKDKYPDHVNRGWGMEVADHVLGQLYNIKACFDLIEKHQEENGFVYDVIIRGRPDEFWFDRLQDNDIEYVANNNSLGTPQHYISVISGGHINDRFAMGSFNVIKRYCEMFNYVEDYAKLAGNDEATEFYVDYHVRNTMRDVSIHNIDATFMLEYPGDYNLEKGFNPTTMRHLEQNDSNVAIAVAESIKSS
jgi:hypothetical protein